MEQHARQNAQAVGPGRDQVTLANLVDARETGASRAARLVDLNEGALRLLAANLRSLLPPSRSVRRAFGRDVSQRDAEQLSQRERIAASQVIPSLRIAPTKKQGPGANEGCPLIFSLYGSATA